MPFPVEEQYVEAAERELGRRLPEPLRTRLLRDNGGELEGEDDAWRLHPVWDPSDKRRMGRTANHIVRETQQARQWPGFPEGALAVASNGSGDLLVLRPRSSALERWDHETGACTPAEVPLD